VFRGVVFERQFRSLVYMELFKSNCLSYVLDQIKSEGGYLIMRKSHVGWWPHFLWSKDLTGFKEFVPEKAAHRRMFPPPWFKGYVRDALVGPPNCSVGIEVPIVDASTPSLALG
jgi:hypothetical protein